MATEHQRIFGRTGLKAGRLGISSSYRAPAKAFEMAFERGCNYFTWGTFIRGQSDEMAQAIRNIIASGQRDRLILAMFGYWHNNMLNERILTRGLRKLGTGYADVFLLGWYPKHPSRRTVEQALKWKEQGRIRFLGISGHNRSLFPDLFREGLFDIYHIRYNAVHTGAEEEVFPFIPEEAKPGIVSFTATTWGKLLKKKYMPPGEEPLTAQDCYRFVLANPAVDICMVGARTEEEMKQDLQILDMPPLQPDEMERIRTIGKYIHGS